MITANDNLTVRARIHKFISDVFSIHGWVDTNPYQRIKNAFNKLKLNFEIGSSEFAHGFKNNKKITGQIN